MTYSARSHWQSLTMTYSARSQWQSLTMTHFRVTFKFRYKIHTRNRQGYHTFPGPWQMKMFHRLQTAITPFDLGTGRNRNYYPSYIIKFLLMFIRYQAV
jgi:hypothetical protein